MDIYVWEEISPICTLTPVDVSEITRRRHSGCSSQTIMEQGCLRSSLGTVHSKLVFSRKKTFKDEDLPNANSKEVKIKAGKERAEGEGLWSPLSVSAKLFFVSGVQTNFQSTIVMVKCAVPGTTAVYLS